MEPDVQYYRRRIAEERAAAEHAITEAARLRRLQLVESYLSHLEDMGEPLPITRDELGRLKAACTRHLRLVRS